MPIIGHFIAYKSGHRLNNLLLKELMSHKECWKMVNHISKDSDKDNAKYLNIPSFSVLDTINNQMPVA
jgi:UDP-3-O-[3-hydroxymyristoyl] N-acetylglucosamine deacetylase